MYSNNSVSEIDVQQLAVKMAEGTESLQLIDVREKSEFAIAKVPGFDLYPLSEFEQWSEKMLVELKPEAETLVMCHYGMRSAQLCQWLASRGFSNVHNIMGGIDAYSRFIDNRINRY